jgi:AraC-like DNA-binding protein
VCDSRKQVIIMKFEYTSGALPFLLDSLGYLSITRDAGYQNSFPKGKSTHTFFYTTAGEMCYRFSGGRDPITAPEGILVYIPPNVPYSSCYTADSTNVRLLHFQIAQGALPPRFDAPFALRDPAAQQLILRNEQLTGSAFLAARAYDLLSALSVSTDALSPAQRKLRPAVDALRQNYRENRKINDYAQLCHMSESNFRRLFTALYGKSPIAYRNSLRLSHAKTLIESGEFTVEEAAFMAGFQNMSFFYQSCKREFGTSHLKK